MPQWMKRANIERDSGRTELWREPNFLMLSSPKLAKPISNEKDQAELENIERVDLTAAGRKQRYVQGLKDRLQTRLTVCPKKIP